MYNKMCVIGTVILKMFSYFSVIVFIISFFYALRPSLTTIYGVGHPCPTPPQGSVLHLTITHASYFHDILYLVYPSSVFILHLFSRPLSQPLNCLASPHNTTKPSQPICLNIVYTITNELIFYTILPHGSYNSRSP